jgi:hypothetical protein
LKAALEDTPSNQMTLPGLESAEVKALVINSDNN